MSIAKQFRDAIRSAKLAFRTVALVLTGISLLLLSSGRAWPQEAQAAAAGGAARDPFACGICAFTRQEVQSSSR